MLKADGLDKALIGVGRRCGQDDILVYSVDRCLKVLMDNGSTYLEALEHFEFNILGAWVGPETPMWVYEDREALEELFGVTLPEPEDMGALTERGRTPMGT
jgi:hypothetical protein